MLSLTRWPAFIGVFNVLMTVPLDPRKNLERISWVVRPFLAATMARRTFCWWAVSRSQLSYRRSCSSSIMSSNAFSTVSDDRDCSAGRQGFAAQFGAFCARYCVFINFANEKYICFANENFLLKKYPVGFPIEASPQPRWGGISASLRQAGYHAVGDYAHEHRCAEHEHEGKPDHPLCLLLDESGRLSYSDDRGLFCRGRTSAGSSGRKGTLFSHRQTGRPGDCLYMPR